MAHEDLPAIMRFVSKDNPTQTHSFGQKFRGKTGMLAQHPQLDLQGRPGLPEGLRELVVHPHYIVFYRVLPETRTVGILRLKHAAQQMP